MMGAWKIAFFAGTIIELGASATSAFNRIATFPICQMIDPKCDTDQETVAEIVAATDDGMMLIYTDAEQKNVGFVDISNPAEPVGDGTTDVGGEPTSVGVLGEYALVAIDTSTDYVTTAGELKVIKIADKSVVRSIDLGGQPDAVAISPDHAYAAIAIENERDEDLGEGVPPQMPAGFLVIVNTSGDVADWTTKRVELTSLDGAEYPTDPEPEYVSINSQNVAAVTLQENNAIVLVDLATAAVTKSFTAGVVEQLTKVDDVEEDIINQSSTITNVVREPDGVTWISDTMLATADEGDLNGGSRGWTVFDTDGNVVYTSGNTVEHKVAEIGHYPEHRSENKGNEPENVFFGVFGGKSLLFVNSERANVVLVYDVDDPASPEFLQVLPAGVGPEGGVAIPSRDLIVVASENDNRDDKVRASLSIYKHVEEKAAYPTLVSAERESGEPIPFSALSGLAAGPDGHLFSVEDSAYKKSRIFKIDVSAQPVPKIVEEIRMVDSAGALAGVTPYGDFSAEDLAKLINDDNTVNIDPEGIAATDDYLLVASEGRGTVGDAGRPIESLNFLLKVDYTGQIQEVITLPDDFNDMQERHGFEGVAIDGGVAYVVMQRAWGSEANPRIGMYDMANKTWTFAFYPLDESTSQNGGWVGLSDIAPLGNKEFLVLERDNQFGPDAAIKKIYKIDLSSVEPESTVEKTEHMDLMNKLQAHHGFVVEKVEGLAVMPDGAAYIVNDNDGVDDNSGETLLLMEPAPAKPTPKPPTPDDKDKDKDAELSPARRQASCWPAAALAAAALASPNVPAP